MKTIWQAVLAILVTVAIVGAYAKTLPAQEAKHIEQVVTTQQSLPYGWTVELKDGSNATGKVFFNGDNVIVALYSGEKVCAKMSEVLSFYSASNGAKHGSANGGGNR